MIGRKAERILNRAVSYALAHQHEYFTLEHVLLSLLEEESVAETIRACNGNLDQIAAELEAWLEREVPRMQKSSRSQTPPHPSANDTVSDPAESAAEDPAQHPVATLSIQRLIQRALFHVQSAGKDEIQPIDLFVALFQAKDSFALHVLQKAKIERLDVLNFISHGGTGSDDGAESGSGDRGEAGEDADDADAGRESGDGPSSSRNSRESQGSGGGRDAKSASRNDALAEYAVNLNERASNGKIDPLVGRDLELERVIQTLCRRRKNNPLLVGEAGVGKTAIAEGLALRITEGKVPPLLRHTVVYALDMGSLVAGTKFRGDFEQRLKKVIASLDRKRRAGVDPVLMIDEIHTIIGAGSVSGGTMDAANLLKPLLTRGELKVIGSTTYAEYRSTFEKDHALARRFQKIDVPEPTQDETFRILQGLRPGLEKHHQVSFTDAALRAAVELSSKHLTDRFLPDKAIDILDEAGARARLRAKPESEVNGEVTHHGTIDAAEIEAVIAQVARIPERSVSISQKERLQKIDKDLKLSIFGQDAAIDAIVTAIRLARSGLRTGEKPVGSFLFCGPTGVGKTEVTKQLAHSLGVPFLRYDMSEYGERHTVSRLIGAPPGYVGFEQSGLLTDAVLKNPYSVILLDEIEKAHPEIWNILLQVMDHGTLTDNNGRKADFRNAIIIMTSNVGSREMERRSLSIVSTETTSDRAKKAVEQAFTPEFRNRLDAIVYFNPLDPVTVGHVVGKQLIELESQLLAKNVEIEFTAEARAWLAERGYDRLMGARPLGRIIQDKIKKHLANEILFGALEHGGSVEVGVKGEGTEAELTFSITAKPAPEPGKESILVEKKETPEVAPA